MCYYHQNCLLVCLSVSQTSMDDSGHKGNTGQPFNTGYKKHYFLVTNCNP